MNSSDLKIWFEAYTTYQKDPRVIERWLEVIESDPIKALDIARRLTVAETVPDTVTLGFSPQILVAILAVNYPKPIKVVTSPEVEKGLHPAAKHSHRVLKIYAARRLVERTVVTPMVPSESVTPRRVLESIERAFSEVKPKILDISGGTQLVALAATRLNIELTYTYPHGEYVKIYRIG